MECHDLNLKLPAITDLPSDLFLGTWCSMFELNNTHIPSFGFILILVLVNTNGDEFFGALTK